MARELLMNAAGFDVFDSQDRIQLGKQPRFDITIKEHNDGMVSVIGHRKSRFLRLPFHALAVEPRRLRESPKDHKP
jgi:hypothetical protein